MMLSFPQADAPEKLSTVAKEIENFLIEPLKSVG